jgi:hypothetical protein
MILLSPQYFSCITLLTIALSNLLGQTQIAIGGNPVEGIDYKPLPAIFATVARGAIQETSLEITNRRPVPLKIFEIANSSQRFSARVETLEEGRLFRLIVTLKGDGEAGKQQHILQLKTNSARGICSRSPRKLSKGEKLRFLVELSIVGGLPKSRPKVSALGVVTRVHDLRDGSFEFAAKFTKIHFP